MNLKNTIQIANRRTFKGSTKKIIPERKKKTHSSLRISNKLKDKDSSNNNLADFSRRPLKKKSKTMLIKKYP